VEILLKDEKGAVRAEAFDLDREVGFSAEEEDKEEDDKDDEEEEETPF